MPATTQYDVFVSHNRLDKPWVRKFVAFLRRQKLRVFFDEDSIEYGADIVTSVDTAIERSTHVLLLISPNSTRSKWVALESSVSVYSDPDAQDKKIIPVVLAPVPSDQLTASIRRLNRVDLTNHDQREATLRRLLKQLGVQDEYVNLPDWQDSTADQAKPTTHESIYRFRQPAHEWYVARNEEQFIREILSDDSGSIHKNILVTGRTGFGKSSFLTWLSREAREQGGLVIDISPNSDRVNDFLALLTQHILDQVESLDLSAPRLKGIPKLDIDAMLNRILTKTTSRLVIVVDQIERLFPYAANIAASAVWRSITDTLSTHFRNPRIVWVFAVKEWYFLSLFPSEFELRLINFTFVSLGDLRHEQATRLVERLSALTNADIDDQALDLFVTKAGGRPLTLVLAFLVALERSPKNLQLGYEYLAETEPWNEIFEGEYSCLESHRQRLIVLALAHAHRELVPKEEVIRKVTLADNCSRSDVEADLKPMPLSKEM